jgi:2-dehydro-3-deoxygluconokinase
VTVEVVTLGECLVSFVAVEPGPLADISAFRAVAAGAEANVAVGVARLGHASAFVGRVGTDPFGRTLMRALRGEGVDVAHLRPDDAPTGLMIRDRPALGPGHVEYRRTGSAGSRLAPVDVAEAAEVFATASWLHVSGVTAAISPTAREAVGAAIELAAAHGLQISLDLNLRRRLWTDAEAAAVLRPLAARADVVLGSLDEFAAIAGPDPAASSEELVTAALALGAPTIVFKLGDAGAFEASADGPIVVTRPPAVASVIDVVGAGDAFCAGWIVATLEGLAGAERLSLANACGAASVGAMGDQAGLPTRVEADRLMTSPSGAVLR